MSAEVHGLLIVDLETALNALRDKNSVIAFECVQNALERLEAMQPKELERRSEAEERLLSLRQMYSDQALRGYGAEQRVYEGVASALGQIIQQVFNERQ
jgi:hypothetical protein